MVRVISVPLVLEADLPMYELPCDGHSYSREHIVTRVREARPTQEELDYLRRLADRGREVTVVGSRWER